MPNLINYLREIGYTLRQADREITSFSSLSS